MGQEESEVGVFIPLVPCLPGCHGCLQPSALWVPLATPWGPAGRPGVNRLPAAVSQDVAQPVLHV